MRAPGEAEAIQLEHLIKGYTNQELQDALGWSQPVTAWIMLGVAERHNMQIEKTGTIPKHYQDTKPARGPDPKAHANPWRIKDESRTCASARCCSDGDTSSCRR